ncbi:MAG: hypothetical protein EBR82_14915 [Caulobacteraceae bacterium]|nr:hypothetical protein [Caulobacteraceae bacterium]
MAYAQDKRKTAVEGNQAERLARLTKALERELDEKRVKLGSMEELLVHPLGFGLKTASIVQRAIMRVADGKPLGDLWGHPAVVRAFGGEEPQLEGKPKEMAVLSAIRCGKSLMAACMAVHWTQVCAVEHLGPGEVPRVSIVSINKDLAEVIFGHVVGRVMASPALKGLVMGEPTTDTIVLRHPSGRPVEIKVVAGSRSGSTLVARWSAGAVFDEFPRMLGEGEAVVNWDDMRKAVLLRILPGSQVISIGSPWAPFGPAYNVVKEHYGRPTRNMVVVKAPGWDLNPQLWTPQAVRDAEEKDPQAFRTDVAAEFAQPEESLITQDSLDAATRPAPLIETPKPGVQYSAAIDPATRGNAWTLIIACQEGDKRRVALARQWIGSAAAPLRPGAILEEVARLCRAYRISVLDSDQYYGDALRDLAAQQKLVLVVHAWTEREKLAKFLALKTMFEQGMVEIPADQTLRSDLGRVKKVLKGSGASINFPRTSDGRHCDYAPCLAMALARYWQTDEDVQEAQGELSKLQAEERVMLKRILDRAAPKDGWGYSW